MSYSEIESSGVEGDKLLEILTGIKESTCYCVKENGTNFICFSTIRSLIIILHWLDDISLAATQNTSAVLPDGTQVDIEKERTQVSFLFSF